MLNIKITTFIGKPASDEPLMYLYYYCYLLDYQMVKLLLSHIN